MKKTILFPATLFLSVALFAQTKTPAKPVKKPAAPVIKKPPIVLKNLADSAGYALGVDVGSSLQSQSMTGINRPLINQSLNDILDGKPSLIEENSCFLVLNNYSTKMEEEKARAAANPAQKPATPKPQPKPVKSSATGMKTLADSAGYALGVNIASSLKLQDMTRINREMIICGLNDVLDNKPTLINKNNAYPVIVSFSNLMAREKAQVIITEGQAFLEKNKLRPEVKTTASGLQYEVISEGTGIKPAALDTFVCHYRGSLVDGTEFDASYRRNEPLVYPVGGVIPGWTEGLQLMNTGSKYKFYIPYNLGYGLRGFPPSIPGGAALIFEVELLEVRKRM